MRPIRNRPASNRPVSPRNNYARGPRVRAGMMMSRNMDFAGIADVEAIMASEGLTLAPMTTDGRPIERVVGPAHVTVTVLPTATVSDVEGLAGLVVPDSAEIGASEGEGGLSEVIHAARDGDVPVMAFGEGVGPTLAAAGFDAPATTPAAVLLHHGVLILETAEDVRDAVKTFASAQAERRAA